jgi:hypothetical protein
VADVQYRTRLAWRMRAIAVGRAKVLNAGGRN